MDDISLPARLAFLEEMARELYRRDILTEEMLVSIAESLSERADHVGDAEAEIAEHAAHMATVLPFEAAAPSPTEFQAEQRRSHIRIVADGGKAKD